jgi:prephenate dehydratase
MQNRFSDRAYRIFERVFERVTANYFPGFREVCEEVYYGRCTYGILPVSSSADGPLLSFHKLQSKYDLKIALEADVEMNDDTVMRFALLKKGLGTLPGSIPDLCGAWRYMDLSFVITENLKTGAFLSSCEVFGAEILNITTAPSAFRMSDYYGERPALTLQFDITGADLEAMYIFLEASHIRYDVSGIYDILT